MTSKFREIERERAVGLINKRSPVFYGGAAGVVYRKKERDFILKQNQYNIYEPFRNDVIKYFKQNSIKWWGGKEPTGHVLSSQIACINHLFQIRNDKDAVLTIINNVSNSFIDVMPIVTDKFNPAYIQFEAVSDHNNLREENLSRGNNCTSIDALILALHKDGSKWLIPVEWKYTEYYHNQNKAIEGFKVDPVNCKGEVRKRRYTDLINKSIQLKSVDHACFYYEPFYQLMRQTLWAEQMILNKESETIKADYFLHLHVIPEENKDLLMKKYKCSGADMETTWRNQLKDQSKYQIISPKALLHGIDSTKYQRLLEYLSVRYL